MPKPDRRSAEAAEYRKFYRTKRWRIRREQQLQAEPLCRVCRAMGLVTAANVADHVIAHRGNADLFWSGALQSLCETHHNGAAQSKDRTGKAITVTGKDGWPIEV